MAQPTALPCLLADIGGTNVRFALSRPGGEAEHVVKLRCDDFAGPVEAAQAYLAQVAPKAPPVMGAFCVACPVLDDEIDVTNNHWLFSIARTRDALGLDTLKVVNDFTAQALAIPLLDDDHLVKVGRGDTRADFPIGVIGPGTGLGVAILVKGGHGKWKALATEGGHVTMPAANKTECELIDLLRERFGHVSAERVISGQGLENLYWAHCTREGGKAEPLSAAEISERGLTHQDAMCGRAVESLFEMLGTVAGNLALSAGTMGGVYIAGGIVPRMVDAFLASEFRGRFEAKGRFEGYNAGIATHVVMHDHPAFLGLSGLLA